VPENNSQASHTSRTQANGKSSGASGRAKAIKASETNVARVLSPQMRGRLWHAWRRSWQGLEGSFKSKVRRHFHELRQAQLEQMKRVLGQASFSAEQARDFSAGERRDLVGQLLFDIADADGSLIAKTQGLYREAMRLGGEQTIQEVAETQGEEQPESDTFNIDDPEVLNQLERRQLKIKDANHTVRENIRRELIEGTQQGESFDELAKRVKHQFNVANNRAQTIARTEVGASVEQGRHEARKQKRVPLKSWLWSRKESGRPTHSATESMTLDDPISNDQDFDIGGTGIRAPHPRATGLPGHDINCGCTTLSRFPDDDVRDVVGRIVQRGFLTYEQLTERDAQPTHRRDADQWTHSPSK
jgi:uncharacterized protein with gpF-like domain